MSNKHLFPYRWNLSDGYPAKGIKPNNCNVFGTFICGGGSSMGYKLAGFNHLGGVEIDPPIADIYKTNHNPKHLFNEDIRAFNRRDNLPKELYNLDVLDGSPPCSTFSMAGSREKAWGKKKKFREGQAEQTLDDLVYTYCDTIIKLKPKVFLLENVKGIIIGNAKAYSKAIVAKMTKAGYKVQVFCLNAASMGVPQKRERVFFIGHRNEFKLPKLELRFSEESILLDNICQKLKTNNLTDYEKKLYYHKKKSDNSMSSVLKRVEGREGWFSHSLLHLDSVCPTLLSDSTSKNLWFDYPYHLNNHESILIGSYPQDYNFKKINPCYLIGMSVPPVMTAQIANQIYIQWLSKIKENEE
jgi:DNA (cytosine-5)-methyltransferase 1